MKKILIAILVLIVLVIGGLAAVVSTFDINQHRPEIQAALSKQTGRSVKLAGDLHIGLSLDGITVSIKDVAFGNPPWASRADMASVKVFNLNLALIPLMSHQVDIKGLVIENADILLENQNEYRRNWEMYEAGEAPTPAPAAPKTAAAKPEAPVAVAFNITSLSIKNSRIGMMGPDRKLTVFNADDLKLGAEGSGVGLHFAGSLNGMPIKLAVDTNADSLMSKAERPIDVTMSVANYYLKAKGTLNLGKEQADLASYELTSGGSKLSGKLLAAWGGARPALQGTLMSDKLVPADLKMESTASGDSDAAKPAKSTAAPQRVFSDAPLGLDALKSADANFDVGISALNTGSVELQNIKTKLVLSNGHLMIAPLDMNLGKGTIAGQVNLEGNATPPMLSSKMTLNDIDLSDFIKMWGAEAFLSGKVKADINLVATGNSMHEMASSLNGTIAMIGAGGDVMSTAANKISSGISEILSPGSGGSSGMNCIVSRFIAQNGTVKANGILIDTSAATIAGYGDIDLRSETLNLDFHTKPKLVSVGGFLPSVHAGGTLAKPDINADAKGVVQNIGNLLTGGSTSDPVPDLQTQQGQNACAYTLDHPSSAGTSAADKGGVVQDVAGKAGNLIKGLFGK